MKQHKITNLTIRSSTSEKIFVEVKVCVAKINVSSSKTWDMVTLKVADKDKYHKIKHYKTVLPKAGSKRYKDNKDFIYY